MKNMKEMKFEILDWPGNFPDLNPIEICGQSSNSAVAVKTVQQKQSL